MQYACIAASSRHGETNFAGDSAKPNTAPYAFAVKGADVLGITLGNVRILDDYALYGLSNVRYVYLGNVESVGKGVFLGCASLEYIGVSENNSSFINDEQGALYGVVTSNKYNLIAYPAGNAATEYRIKSQCTTILPFAFAGADTLIRVSYGGNLATIGDYAFYGCSALTSVTIGNGVTSIDDYAFSDRDRKSVV